MTASPRILIVRLSAIGDVIQGLPIACALRERFPDAFLAWVVQRPAAGLLEGHAALDELIDLPRGWLKSPRGVWQLRRRLRDLRFDVALDAQGLTKSALLAWLSGAPRRIGFGRPWGRELSRWLNTETADAPGPHIVQRNLQLLRPLGIESPSVRFQLPERPEDRQKAEEIIKLSGLDRGFARMNVGAGWPSKLWPTERYAATAEYLGETHQMPTLVLWFGPKEQVMAEKVVAGSRGHARLAPATSLGELASLARRARLFIGSDTGPLHLAAAVGTPCVGLYGPWPREVHGPYGPRHMALQKAYFEGATRRRRRAPRQLMKAIEVEDVCEACETILQRSAES